MESSRSAAHPLHLNPRVNGSEQLKTTSICPASAENVEQKQKADKVQDSLSLTRLE